jgi:HEAT repeat protein
LRVVDGGFGRPGDEAADDGSAHRDTSQLDVRGVATAGRRTRHENRPTRLDQAWSVLGGLDATDPHGLETIVAATRSPDASERQVAARLLADAAPEVAHANWAAMLTDQSRAVRRAVLDVAVDAERETLRPLLERALADRDAWVRWKALHGLAVLGGGSSTAMIEQLLQDADFRVRLEARNALSSIRG